MLSHYDDLFFASPATRQGATEDELDTAERTLGVVLPDALRALLRAQNGGLVRRDGARTHEVPGYSLCTFRSIHGVGDGADTLVTLTQACRAVGMPPLVYFDGEPARRSSEEVPWGLALLAEQDARVVHVAHYIQADYSLSHPRVTPIAPTFDAFLAGLVQADHRLIFAVDRDVGSAIEASGWMPRHTWRKAGGPCFGHFENDRWQTDHLPGGRSEPATLLITTNEHRRGERWFAGAPTAHLLLMVDVFADDQPALADALLAAVPDAHVVHRSPAPLAQRFGYSGYPSLHPNAPMKNPTPA